MTPAAIRKLQAAGAAWLVGMGLTMLAGKILLLPVGDGLARLSYDVPFVFRDAVPDGLVVVYLDDQVKKNLHQPQDQPLDRRFYTRLLERLTREKARLVLFDLIFDEPHPNVAVDAQFAEAIRAHGRVVLVGRNVLQPQGNVAIEAMLPPASLLAGAAAGWGLAQFPYDPDFGIRRMEPGDEDHPSSSWVAARLLAAPVTQHRAARPAECWLNYYCPPEHLRAVNLDHALEANGLPDGYFRDKLVVVGARPGVGSAGAEREEFRNPYSRFGGGFCSGPAIQAFALLNLMRGDWMTRLGFPSELALILIWGAAISALLMCVRPWLAVMVAPACFVAVALAAAYVQVCGHVWFSWLVPAGIQTSVALAWSVGYQYLVEARRRKKLRRAFSVYLSPYMADRIANSEFDLTLGGKEVEATVMFTDLEGFTKMSESLPPAEVSKILTAYFNQTTRAILEQEGTIIKYIGDAVMAVWGAPLPDPKHAERAVLAAWGMSEAGKQEVHGRRLRTRLGINTGMVLAGNLGSDFRFDYTLIGDTTNFASRLEGLNKQLGTNILISESTRAQLGDAIKLRPLGKFIVAGKLKSVGIFEVLGPATSFPSDPLWLVQFAEAMEQFTRRELEAAERSLREIVTLRGADGPAEFYLKEIARARARPDKLENWDAAVRVDSK